MPPTTAASPGARAPRLLLALALTGLVGGLVGCDHATKHLAASRLAGRPAVTLVGGVLDLRYVENRDSAFNLSRVLPPRTRRPILLVSGIAVVLIAAGLWWRSRRAPRAVHLALALVVAGGLGNVLDRALRGYVIDFVHLHHWPVFNAADAYLLAGVGLLLVAARRPARPPAAAPG